MEGRVDAESTQGGSEQVGGEAARKPQGRLTAPRAAALLGLSAPVGCPRDCPMLLASCTHCVPRVTLQRNVGPSVELPAYTH